MQNSKFTNSNNQPATIELDTGYNTETKQVIKEFKTWEQLTDSDKQRIASIWIRDHVYCNVNQVMELLEQNNDHIDYYDYLNIAEFPDYDSASSDHINYLSIDELIQVIEEYDLDIDHTKLFADKYLIDLIENTKNTNMQNYNIFHELNITFLSDIEENQANEKALIDFFKHNFDTFSFDDLDTCTTNLNINFDGYLKAYQSDLANMVIDNIDLDEYGQNNNLDPEYQQAYEFWSVSDHFVALIGDNCCNDILGLSVWARYCTGQSISLDHQIQIAAFKVLSDTDYNNY